MIEKITGERITVYKHRDSTAVGDQFVLDEKMVVPDKPDQSGEVTEDGHLDKLCISPEYHAVKNLTATAASLAQQTAKIDEEKLQGIRRKIQDGFYLNEGVLTTTADQLLTREFKL